jgi:hypothetical protein
LTRNSLIGIIRIESESENILTTKEVMNLLSQSPVINPALEKLLICSFLLKNGCKKVLKISRKKTFKVSSTFVAVKVKEDTLWHISDQLILFLKRDGVEN